MAQVNVIGRITADLELKTSEKSNPYVRFDIAENIGSRQTLHTQYFQVCAWGEDANRLMKAHAKKGSLIWVTGSLELEPYTKRDGISIYRFQRVLCKLSCLLSFHLLLEHSRSGHSSVRVPMGSSFHSVSAFLKMYSKSTKAFWA